jgi:hypothetical protein
MSELAEPSQPIATVRICALCKWSRSADGDVFRGQDRAYCAQPDVRSDSGAPVPCESQRFATSSPLLMQCGADAIYFEER